MAQAQPIDFSKFGVLPAPSDQPTIRERATEANIEQSRASAISSQASAASSQATAEEKRALLPARIRNENAVADLNELRARQAKLALEKARQLTSSRPIGEKVPEARQIILRELRNLAQAKDISQSMFSGSGIGYDTLRHWSGSPAATVEGLIQPITSNEAFNALAAMRAASPTGGALGNVTERELDLLKSSGGFIPPTAGDKAFQQGIDDLIAKRIQVLNKLGVAPDELAAALGPDNAKQFAPLVQSYRFLKEDEDAIYNYASTKLADGTFDPSDYAALMGQAYYNATGNQPDEAYIKSAFETGVSLMDRGATSLGSLRYDIADEDARNRLLMESRAAKPEELGIGETIGGALINFLPSTFELAADTVKALTVDLPNTLEGVAKIIGGAVGLADDKEYEAIKDYFAERYGSLEGFKRAVRNDPASIAADIVGVASGGGLLAAKTASTTSKLTRIAQLAEAAKKAEGFAAAAAKLDPLNIAAQTTSLAANVGARAAENVGVALPAKLLGVQTADVKQAASAGRRGSQEFLDNLEGRVPPADALAKADAAINELYQARSRDYARRMARLKKSPETLDFTDVLNAVDEVRNVGRHKGIDISGAGGVWDEVDAKIGEFEAAGLNLIEDFDAMKQAIGNIRDKYQRGTPEYKVANDVVRAINKTITAKAPIYASVMEDYRLASDTLADIKSSLSMGAKSADTTLRKLRRAASGRGPRGRTVLDILESTKSGRGLGDMLAAQNLSGTEPTGIGASVGAVGAASMGDPTLLTASAASPKGLGKLAYTVGQGMANIDRVRNAAASLPGVDRLGTLAEKYLPPARTGLTLANPAVIQPLVDPVEIQQQETPIDKLAQAYSVRAPTIGGGTPGQPSLEDLQSKYDTLTLGGFQPYYEDAAPYVAPDAAQGAGQSTIVIDGRVADRDPVTGQMIFVDTGEPVPGYGSGGLVNKPREQSWAEWARGTGRAVAKGALLGWNDEAEAWLRALSRLDPAAYRHEVERIRAQEARFLETNPGTAIAAEISGAFIPALIPGGQAATGARLASLAVKAPRVARALPVAAQSVVYGAGEADNVRDIPRSVRDEFLYAAPVYGAGELASPYIKRGAAAAKAKLDRFRVRK
jgi:hypothetical protein